MKTARYYGRGDIRVEEVADPVIDAADDVLLEVASCGICGTDLHEYVAGPIITSHEPHPLTGATLPQTLGHEFSARVVATGDAVTNVRPGDRVAVMPSIVCHRCHFCRRGLQYLCESFGTTGLTASTGGLGEYAVVSEYQVTRLPDVIGDDEGAVIEPAAVAACGVDRGGLEGGETVLVTGAGPIGALTALYAVADGAGLVVVAEPNPNRAARAEALDVGPVLDPTAGDFADSLAELTGGIGVDTTIECSGTEPGLATAIANTRKGGRVVQTGLHTKPASIDAMALSEKSLDLLGSWCFRITDWPRVIRLVATGRYPVGKVITSVIGVADVVPSGFDVLTDSRADQLKVLVHP